MKEKTCKGNGLAKGYGCGKLTQFRIYGLGKMCCYSDWLLNSENGKIKLAKSLLTAKKISNKKERLKVKEFRENDKTIKQLIADAKKPFQHFIRLRDSNKPCISCGTKTANIVDGGHFYKAELYTGLIFNENNCHLQCGKCNRFLGGNENLYRLGLIERYGNKFVLELDELAIKNKIYKFTRQELIYIKIKYQKKVLELTKIK